MQGKGVRERCQIDSQGLEGKSGFYSWLKTQHSKNEDHGIWCHHLMENRWGTMEIVTDFIFLGSKITVVVTAATKLKDTCSLEEKLWPT